MKKILVYDIEIFKQCLIVGFINPKTGNKKIFEVSNRKNNSRSLYKFLKNEVKGLIGFNNLSYDNTIINYFLRTRITNPLKYYELSQRIIVGGLRAAPQLIPQLDIYKINHWDNKAKILGLKAAEARMNFHNVADLPYPFDKDLNHREIQKVVDYLHNDLEATAALYELYKNKYYLRNEIKKKYSLKCDNWSDSKLGEQVVLKLYCEKTNSDPDLVRKLRSPRKSIKVSDIIFPYIKFKTPQLKELLNTIKEEVITDTKGGFKHVFEYGGIETYLAQGGIHAAKPGIYKTTEDKLVLDLDVSGMYPSIIIANKLYPEHLGPEFCEVLDEDIVTPRLLIHKPKSKDKTLHWRERKLHAAFSDGFKLSGNSVYGKSNDKYSFLYDPKFTMSVTINGQLMLLMLLETLHENLDLEIIYENTDGFSVIISPEDKPKLEQYVQEWEKTTGLTMEYQLFDSFFVRDVNNIIAKSGEYIKLKGAYEVDKKIGDEPVLHKDNSMRVVRLAVREYFINNTPVEETLKNHDNIYDFCLNKQAKSGWFFFMSHKPDSQTIELRNTKTLRYYVSTSGSVIYKNHKDGRKTYLEAGLKGQSNKGHYWKLKLFNKFKEKEMKDYNIDYSYYLREATKLIDAIEKHTQPEEKTGK